MLSEATDILDIVGHPDKYTSKNWTDALEFSQEQSQ